MNLDNKDYWNKKLSTVTERLSELTRERDWLVEMSDSSARVLRVDDMVKQAEHWGRLLRDNPTAADLRYYLQGMEVKLVMRGARPAYCPHLRRK